MHCKFWVFNLIETVIDESVFVDYLVIEGEYIYLTIADLRVYVFCLCDSAILANFNSKLCWILLIYSQIFQQYMVSQGLRPNVIEMLTVQ